MDRHFLEFWGNFLLQVANGQKQLEDLAKWSKQGVNFGDFTTLFRQAYGLEQLNAGQPRISSNLEKGRRGFSQLFSGLLEAVGRDSPGRICGTGQKI